MCKMLHSSNTQPFTAGDGQFVAGIAVLKFVSSTCKAVYPMSLSTSLNWEWSYSHMLAVKD